MSTDTASLMWLFERYLSLWAGLCIATGVVLALRCEAFYHGCTRYSFFEYIFSGLVEPQTAKEYIAGMILLGVAPCTAMVFVWS